MKQTDVLTDARPVTLHLPLEAANVTTAYVATSSSER